MIDAQQIHARQLRAHRPSHQLKSVRRSACQSYTGLPHSWAFVGE